MASYDKIIKYVVEQIQTAMLPLKALVTSQETLVKQNDKIIALLEKMAAAAPERTDTPAEQCCCQPNSGNNSLTDENNN